MNTMKIHAFAWKLRKLSTHDKNEHYFLPENVSLIIDTQLTLFSVNEGQDVLNKLINICIM